jgi:hypothetical protein
VSLDEEVGRFWLYSPPPLVAYPERELLQRFGSNFQVQNVFAGWDSSHCQDYSQPSQGRLNVLRNGGVEWVISSADSGRPH